MNKDGISIDELRSLLAEYSVVPLWRKRPAMRTPVEALKKFKSISEQCFILESLEDNQRWGRWTFLGFDPKLELSCIDGVVRIREAVGGGGGGRGSE